jgi:hypothetical protein
MGRSPETYGTRRQVWNGTKERTAGGLRRRDLMLGRDGKIISKKVRAEKQEVYLIISEYSLAWAEGVVRKWHILNPGIDQPKGD